MFEKFGEFDSAEAINDMARILLEDGDHEGVITLAKENGIDEEDAKDFIAGDIEALTTVQLAAVGKLAIEHEDIKPEEIMEDWFDYISKLVLEDEEFAIAVRKKGKSLVGCFGALLKWSWKAKYTVNAKICEAAGVNGRVQMGIPGNMRARVIIREYYLED